MSELEERLANAAIIEIARQTTAQIGNTGHDDYTDMAWDEDIITITISRSELGRALAAAIEK